MNQEILLKCLVAKTEPPEPIAEIKLESFDCSSYQDSDEDVKIKLSSSRKTSTESEFGWDNSPDELIEQTVKVKLKPKKRLTISSKCEYCNKQFVNRYVLKKHKQNMHLVTREKQTCKICNRTVMSMSLHMRRKHNGEFKYKCKQKDCNEKYFYKSHLMEHVRTEHVEESILAKKENLLCTHCGKILHSRKAYGYHVLLHSGEKPFKCNFCDKQYRSHNYLRIHERSHTDERPYPCTHCDRAFRDSGTLKGHVRTHTGEKPFVCNICGRGFAQRIALKTHMKIH